MENSNNKEAKGYLILLTNKNNIYLLAFLADVLALFSRYQQTIQSDKITVLDLVKCTKSIVNKLKKLSSVNLVGGWIDVLEDELKSTDGKTLKDIKLKYFQDRRNSRHNLYVTENRSTNDICCGIVESLPNFLQERIDVDEHIVNIIKPVVNLDSNVNIKIAYYVLGKDLDLAVLNMEYTVLMEHDKIEVLRQMPLSKLVQYLSRSNELKNINVLLYCIVAAKPHSADVACLISKSNILKSVNRQSLHVETEN